jgi:hypothetical protein
MKTLALLCIFVLLFTSGFAAAENFVVSGVSPTTISSGTLTISTFNYGLTFPVAGAKWVWNQNWQTSPAG